MTHDQASIDAHAGDCIFHITTRTVAEAARAGGEYRAESLAGEGFIHLSQAHQVLEVAAAYYAGQTGLVVLVVDPELLAAELRFEAPSHPAGQAASPGTTSVSRTPRHDHGSLFPHLYGPLNANAIIDVVDLERFSGQAIDPETASLIRHYRFERLPVEGTLFKSTWAAEARTAADRNRPDTEPGPAGTAMIGLYAENPESVSCFHRLDYDEVWHFYGGDPLVLYLLHPDGDTEEVIMGGDPLMGEKVQFVVPAGTWQAGCVMPGSRHALFGCTMAPGFTAGCFEAGIASELIASYPDEAEIIQRLSINGGQRRMPEGFAAG